jgi:uncharacterized protein YjbI with pentapeptide repeats
MSIGSETATTESTMFDPTNEEEVLNVIKKLVEHNLFRHAELQDACLFGANLTKASLRNADLRNADLRGANFWGVLITPKQLTQIVIVDE